MNNFMQVTQASNKLKGMTYLEQACSMPKNNKAGSKIYVKVNLMLHFQ